MEINYEKSKLWISPNVTKDRNEAISNFLHIRSSCHLGTYLGYPLKAKYTTSDFNQIINKLQQKLTGMEAKPLIVCMKSTTYHCHNKHYPKLLYESF